MRFPSLSHLAAQAGLVLRRFPVTMLCAVVAAVASIFASESGDHPITTRLAFVAALGLPLSVAVRLWAEGREGRTDEADQTDGRNQRGFPSVPSVLSVLLVLSILTLFYFVWPGVDLKHQAIRYFQLSATFHLAVAFLPFVGMPESIAFWQYNRKLLLGFLRAGVFSGVLFVGVTIALGALDHLFGVHIRGQLYADVFLIMAFVVNTWIFLASVPRDLRALAADQEYPRALKVFTQYILTPLAFGYLIILLAYLVKILTGAQWPSGWIGWLVGSVAVTGILGFLLVHPLRTAEGEGWIRTYARWLFIGLMPAAVMLLVAFWKRIVPYGLTEPRVLGILLGLWLFGIALAYTLRPAMSIRIVPISLATILLLTLYGPAGLSTISVSSQRARLADNLHAANRNDTNLREAGASLRFLIEHGARKAIATAVGKPLPSMAWTSLDDAAHRDSLAELIMTTAGVRYLEGSASTEGLFYGSADRDAPIPVEGFTWTLLASSSDSTEHSIAGDSVRVHFDTASALSHITVGHDTLTFDLMAAGRFVADSARRSTLPEDHRRLESSTGARRGALWLESINGERENGKVRVYGWSGTLLVGK